MKITCDNCGLEQDVDPLPGGSQPQPESTNCRDCHTPLAVPSQSVVVIHGRHGDGAEAASHN